MALLRKRQKFHAGLPELVGFVFLFVTAALGVRWVLARAEIVENRRTMGRIVEVIAGDSATPRIVFTYTVDGIVYSNMAEPHASGRTLASLLPVAIMAQLSQHGIADFDDLPEEVRRQIREGSTHSFDELSAADRQALANHGYQNSEQLRIALLSAMDDGSGNDSSQQRDRRVRVDVSVPVVYDPDDPTRSTIAPETEPGDRASWAGLMPFLLAATLTFAYYGAVYPKMVLLR